ncbi:MAG: hypothetical protein CM15mP39_07260 [Synechococcus sp.]|nr:MAG: hypothetical protein CM15mP39_07260 [Synechococcus sp.]
MAKIWEKGKVIAKISQSREGRQSHMTNAGKKNFRESEEIELNSNFIKIPKMFQTSGCSDIANDHPDFQSANLQSPFKRTRQMEMNAIGKHRYSASVIKTSST